MRRFGGRPHPPGERKIRSADFGREHGGAVLLISEDLDELLELADRIVVMSEGRIVYETSAAAAERRVLGAHMGGGHHAPAEQETTA